MSFTWGQVRQVLVPNLQCPNSVVTHRGEAAADDVGMGDGGFCGTTS